VKRVTPSTEHVHYLTRDASGLTRGRGEADEGVHIGCMLCLGRDMLVRLSDTSNRHIWKHHAEYEVNLFSGYV
jgi:hypothetical protein